MIRVSGPSGHGGLTPARGSQGPRAAGEFQPADPASPSGTAASASPASATALGALIALQSDAGSRRRNRAAAERTLMMLERLRDGLISGKILLSDLEGLANAANAKLDDPDSQAAALYAEIALRARVELAKLGR